MVEEWLEDIGQSHVLSEIDAAIQKEDRWSFSYVRDITGGVSHWNLHELTPDSGRGAQFAAPEPCTHAKSLRALRTNLG